jgi:hypothetical protein
MPFPCRSPATKGLHCVFPIWFTQCGRVWYTHAKPQPCCSKSDLSRPRHSVAWEWHGISVGCPETECGWPGRVRLLPATTQSSTKLVISSIPICETVGLSVRLFLATMRTFTKDTALSENGRGAAWHVWISLYSCVGYAIFETQNFAKWNCVTCSKLYDTKWYSQFDERVLHKVEHLSHLTHKAGAGNVLMFQRS